jgi:hypothetical protein
VWNRLNSWKVKFLSQAEKEILLKAVIQAIPTYSMSVLKLPHGLCKELHGLIQNFWWGHKSNITKKKNKKKNPLDELGTYGFFKDSRWFGI